MSPTPLEEKQSARLRVLRALYEITDGSGMVLVDASELAQHTGLPQSAVEAAQEYLDKEGLIEIMSMDGVTQITHQGVTEVEAALQAPGRPTDHFSPLVIQNVFNAPVGAVQTGSGSTANVVQSINTNTADIVRLIASLRALIPADRVDLSDAADELESEAKSGTPKPSRIRAYLSTLLQAGRDIGTIAPFAVQLMKAFGINVPGF